jgi:hypothetical protein
VTSRSPTSSIQCRLACLTIFRSAFSPSSRRTNSVTSTMQSGYPCLLTMTSHQKIHQPKTFPSGRNGCVRVDALRQSRQRHPGGGLLRARRQYHASRCIYPSDRRFAVSSRSVGLLFTLALWPSMTIRRNGFIGYTLASALQWVTLRKSLLTFLLH